MKFIVHNTGEWVRPKQDWVSASRTQGFVVEYDNFTDIPEFDKKQFEFMLDIGEVCLTSGNIVWQIRN